MKGKGRSARAQASAVPRSGGGTGSRSGGPTTSGYGLNGGYAGGAGGAAAALAMASSAAEARTYGAGYGKGTLWAEEYQAHDGESFVARDGETLVSGERKTEAGYYATEGKRPEKTGGHVATVGHNFPRGLDALEDVEHDAEEDTVYVTDRRGGVSAYNYSVESASDAAGTKEMNPPGAAAVMAGDRVAAASEGTPAARQYVEAYDAYMKDRSSANLVKACDAYYVYRRESGRDVSFGAPNQAGAAKTFEDERARKEREEAAYRAAEEARRDAEAAGSPGGGGFNEDHARLRGISNLKAFSTEGMDEEDRRFCEENTVAPDSGYVMVGSHERIARRMGAHRSTGRKSFAIVGDPGTGKNHYIAQLSALDGRPHLEEDVGEEVNMGELFGSTTFKDGSTSFTEGKLTRALRLGGRVVLNEANAAPPEVLSTLHNVVGSGKGAGGRYVTVSSPEAGIHKIPVHEDAEIYITYNPEGTAREGRLPPALEDRLSTHRMAPLTEKEQTEVIHKQANKILGRAGEDAGLKLTKGEAHNCARFYNDLKVHANDPDNAGGMERAPGNRYAIEMAADYKLGGKQFVLDSAEVYLNLTQSGADEAEQSRQSIHDMFERRFGRG